ncbi:hypothetical protein [Limnobaculum xujianqingii]|uniref:hypothetical protein n=1 Tax=Limnobaculum xujianqingii TaxID=2738837 RepID=UPI00112C93BF|nr:hypothetical protein [Limnobaculum xujianqingii]
MSGNQNIEDLANQIASTLESLPNDGKERQMTITIGGNNHGTVVMGSNITINPPPERVREPQDMSTSELQQLRENWQVEVRSAFWRKWFNTPSLIVFALLIAMLGMILWPISEFSARGIASALLQNNETNILTFPVVIGFASLLLASGIWFDRVRKVEDRLIKENKEQIDNINVILRRRGY